MKQLSKRIEKPDCELGERLTQLFNSALNGDEQAYHAFLESVAHIVRSFLLRSLKSEHRSKMNLEDLVQEVLLTIHNKRHLYKSGMPVLPWLKVITRHRLIDSIRKNERAPQFIEFDENFAEAVGNESIISMPDSEELLKGLGERQREILVMAKVDDLPHSEIAQRMGISLSAVKVTVHRALNSIRKNYDEFK